MLYSPLAIANEFIRLSGAGGIDHMKLQKLVYYVFESGIKDKRRIVNENPQVWKYGPVFPSLYAEMKWHGSEAIYKPVPEGLNGPILLIENDDGAIAAIRKIWERYKNYSAIQLSALTHNPGTPWYKIVERYNGKVPHHCEITAEDVV